MYRNAVYICISWHSKIFWFPLKNADISRFQGVCHVIHMFFIPKEGIAVPSFIISWYVWQIIGVGALFVPPSMSIPERPILNRVKVNFFLFLIFSWILEKNRLSTQLLDFISESDWETMNEGLIVGVPKEL